LFTVFSHCAASAVAHHLLLRKLIVAQLVKESFAFYGTQRFTPVFTRACPGPCPESDQLKNIEIEKDYNFACTGLTLSEEHENTKHGDHPYNCIF
jgi:hypothetical protein